MIDRPIRPLFPRGWRCETQIVALVLSADLENDPDILAVTGASAALTISDIPFDVPIAAVRVGLGEAGFTINPTTTQLEKSRLDLVVVGSDTELVMVEAGANEVSEKEMIDAILFGHAEIINLVALQKALRKEVGPPRRTVPATEIPADLHREVEGKISGPLWEAMKIRTKIESYRRIGEIEKALLESYPEDPVEVRSFVKAVFEDVHKTLARKEILEKGRRFDDRGFEDIRPITCEVGILPRTHGSALFTRGETQALVTATLGTSEDAQRIDWLEGESQKRFMLHYNFPPFSVGEVKFLRGPGRREIGHGALAERAIRPMMPSDEQFPYTIRLVSDILESNGSSSMASICGGSLALMDAGVPLKEAIGGIAMGLVKDERGYVILSDIAGSEDHYGDMDFKVAGTRKGITALQMDIKVKGLSKEILEKALAQAYRGRMKILDIMETSLPQPRSNISVYAPRIFSIRVPKDKIREVIGPGGKMIRSIIERTGCKIDIDDDGKVDIASVDEASALKAIEIIKEITAEAEIGKTYLGKVVRIVAFGAFVEVLPGIEGLLHISEIAEHRVKTVQDEIQEGEEILVKVIDVDGDRIRLSRKAVLREKRGDQGAPPEPTHQAEPHHAGRPHRRSR